MKILTKNKTYEYPLKVLPVYEWDRVLGFNQSDAVLKLNEVQILKRNHKFNDKSKIFRRILCDFGSK
ncbi:hypothetical protein BbuMM1_N150 (plasmid) [Borreliella burgdorferi]|nr:hypothetical protein BbuMM1_N150 [Borreliella burgdorferi]